MSQTNIKEKLQIFQQKTTNLPTKNYKSPNNETLQNKSPVQPSTAHKKQLGFHPELLMSQTIFNSMPLSIPG